jgi:hypothetical protein
MSNNTLWWSYDPDNNSFAALPAGPLLLPSLGVFALIAARQAIKQAWAGKSPGPGMTLANSSLYAEMRERHDYLVNKKVAAIADSGDGLTLGEQAELTRLQHPSWAKGGSWSF